MAMDFQVNGLEDNTIIATIIKIRRAIRKIFLFSDYYFFPSVDAVVVKVDYDNMKWLLWIVVAVMKEFGSVYVCAKEGRKFS